MADEPRLGRGLQTETIDKRLLWSWGANNYGQLGLGHKDDKLMPADVAVQFFDKSDTIKTAGGGGGFSYLLTDLGKVFTCGNNDRGQLGHGNKENVTVFSLCRCLSQVRITKVAAGWDFMLGISDSGSLLSWGSNSFGQLGRSLNSRSNYDAVPGEVHGMLQGRQTDVAAGLRHAVSVSDCGRVFSWGNGKKGQLGSQGTDGKPVLKSDYPIQVIILEEEKAVMVVAGMYHSGVLTEAGTVFLWGCNKYGQCCTDPETSQTVSHPSKAVCSKQNDQGTSNFVALASGWTHLVGRTALGNIYTWGRGDMGQLGRLCEKSCDYIPHPVSGMTSVRWHSCGSEHNLALTDEGAVYSWGWNEHGICGTGDEKNVSEPHRIPLPLSMDLRVTGIGCGAGHSFCVVMEDSTQNSQR